MPYGVIDGVQTSDRLTGVVQDAAAGSMRVWPAEPALFLAEGGTFRAEVYPPEDNEAAGGDATEPVTYLIDYTEVDANGWLVLSEPLEIDLDAEAALYPLPAITITTASLLPDNNDEPLECKVLHTLSLSATMEEGDRIETPGVRVRYEYVDGEPTVQEVVGRRATVSADIVEGIDGVEAPTESPALTVTGTAETLVIEAEQVPSGVLIEYHLVPVADSDEGFIPVLGDEATRLGPPTRSLVHIAAQVPGGGRLMQDTAYYVACIATNDEGTAAPSAAVEAKLDPDAITNLVAARLVAGFVLAGEVQVGAITISADGGIVIPGAGGTPTIFPADGSPSQIGGHLFALSLTILNNLTLQGLDNLVASGSRLTVASGIAAPLQAPQVDAYHPGFTVPTLPSSTFSGYGRGLAWSNGGFVTTAYETHVGYQRLIRVNTNGTVETNYLTLPQGYDPIGGVTRIGDALYTLGMYYMGTRGGQWWVRRYNASTLAYLGNWRWVPSSTLPQGRLPGIGTDGVNLIVGWTNSSSSATRTVIRRYVAATGADIDVVTCPSGLGDVTGVFRGDFGTGGERYLIAYRTVVQMHTVTGARRPAEEFRRAGAASTTMVGFAYYEELDKFFHIDSSRGLWEYGVQPVDTVRNVSYSWFDSDPAGAGIHETDPGPENAFLQRARTYFRVHPGTPYDTGLVDDPDWVRIWIDGYRQPDQLGDDEWRYDQISQTHTGKAPGFNEAGNAVAAIKSQVEEVGWTLWGDGRMTSKWVPDLPDDVVNKQFIDDGRGYLELTVGSQNIGNDNWTYLGFGSNVSGDGWVYTAGGQSDRYFTCTSAGIYTFNFSWLWSGNSTGIRQGRAVIGSTNQPEYMAQVPGHAAGFGQILSLTRRFSLGQTVRLYVRQTSGGTLAVPDAICTIVKLGV